MLITKIDNTYKYMNKSFIHLWADGRSFQILYFSKSNNAAV